VAEEMEMVEDIMIDRFENVSCGAGKTFEAQFLFSIAFF
jgi:hypothetical protein